MMLSFTGKSSDFQDRFLPGGRPPGTARRSGPKIRAALRNRDTKSGILRAGSFSRARLTKSPDWGILDFHTKTDFYAAPDREEPMSFKENLLEKIEIDRLARKVRGTLGQPGTERKIDREAMRNLLGRTDFSRRDERDMELYVRDDGAETPLVLVLDNDIPLYRTTVDDVLLRKSPTVKEMISVRNAIKILSDKDVVQRRREETLDRLHEQCLAGLDLTFDVSDLEAIAEDGAASLENRYGEGVMEALDLFSEILGWEPPPAKLRLAHHLQTGKKTDVSGGVRFGPSILFSRSRNTLKWIPASLDPAAPDDVERLHRIAEGEAEAEGRDVFARIVDEVRRERPEGFRDR
jgi:hypothetical protein